PGKEERVFAICNKWELDCAVIGKVTDTGRWVVRATPGFDPLADRPIDDITRGRPPAARFESSPIVVCDLPVDVLTEAAPKYDRPQRDDAEVVARARFDTRVLPGSADAEATLLELLRSPNLGSRRWVWRQYDHIVRGGTHVRPGSDAAIVRVPCEK